MRFLPCAYRAQPLLAVIASFLRKTENTEVTYSIHRANMSTLFPTKQDFFSDIPDRQQVLTAHYSTVQVILALEKVGFFELLQSGGRSVNDASRLLAVDPQRLTTCVEFLWSTTDLLEKKTGSTFFLCEQNFRRPFFILEAYKDVFDNFAELLKNTKVYNRDIIRDGAYLQNASDLVTREAIERVIRDATTVGYGRLVDLACGSAQSL